MFLWCRNSSMVCILAPSLSPCCRHIYALVNVTLCHRSLRARTLLCTRGIGTAVLFGVLTHSVQGFSGNGVWELGTRKYLVCAFARGAFNELR